ncbi:Hcp family type VI secretion system effector [Ralstonia sp. 25C]|uniref:Hcp family type VI secretion system effector n=1 Tax=Ralstonia sp. 25C TaxID=3447363 RepID=UPI003F754E18
MAQDIFLKLTGIEGEAMDSRHPNEIDVLSWNWDVTQPSSMHAGTGGGAGKCTVHDLVIEHYVDRATPNLVQHCLTGKHVSEAVLVARKAGGTPLEFLKITMEDVLVSRVKTVCNTNMRAPREQVSLSFARVKQEYVIQNAQGGSAGAVSVGYDIKANKAI